MINALVTHEERKTQSGIFFRRTYTGTSGPPLVLVMGYGGSLRVWPVTFVERLAQTYDVITYDNRGTGMSIVPEDPQDYSIKLMADDLDEVLKELGIGSAHMLGYSMGSCIAMEYAHKHPDKVKTLFIMCGTGGGALYAKPAPELSAALARPEGNTLWELYMSTWKLMYSPAMMEKCQATLSAMFEYSKDLPTKPIALLGHSFAFRGFDGNAYLSEFEMPITILAGEDDRLMPLQNARNLAAALPTAHFVVIPGCEHGPHVQNEDLVISEIEALAK